MRTHKRKQTIYKDNVQPVFINLKAWYLNDENQERKTLSTGRGFKMLSHQEE